MTQREFENQWLNQKVTYRGGFWQIPNGDYVVTAALYEFNQDGESIFAIRHIDGPWFTLHLSNEQIGELDSHFTK